MGAGLGGHWLGGWVSRGRVQAPRREGTKERPRPAGTTTQSRLEADMAAGCLLGGEALGGGGLGVRGLGQPGRTLPR